MDFTKDLRGFVTKNSKVGGTFFIDLNDVSIP